MFKEYLHLERFGNTEVEGIELGVSYIFPKIDGTNASAWAHVGEQDAYIRGGSRKRELSLESDNAGFFNWLDIDDAAKNVREFLYKNTHLRLYGEWLVPHSFKGYRPDAWHKFYIFDVYNDQTEEYLPYSIYQPMLEEMGVLYIPPLAIVKNADYGLFLKYINENHFLCPDGGEAGEGIVIKNYDYKNKFGRQAFAKIVRQEFKELHARAMGAPEINTSLMNEERIIAKVLTSVLVQKTKAKIETEKGGWSNKNIPELLNRVYYDIIKEELWDCLKEINFGTVNFKTLKAMTINKIKELHPEIFR